MDQPGLEAVGIRTEAHVNIFELFASAERRGLTLETRQCSASSCYDNSRTTAELSISMSTLATWSLSRLCMSKIGRPP